MSKIENNIVSYLTAKNCQRIGLVRDESTDRKYSGKVWRGYRFGDNLIVEQERSEETGVSLSVSVVDSVWGIDEYHYKHRTFYNSIEVKSFDKTYKNGIDLDLLSAHLKSILNRIEKIKNNEFSEEEAQNFRDKITAEIKAGEEALTNTCLLVSWDKLDLDALEYAVKAATEIKSRIPKLKAHLEEFERYCNLDKMQFVGGLSEFLSRYGCSYYVNRLQKDISEALENKRTYYC